MEKLDKNNPTITEGQNSFTFSYDSYDYGVFEINNLYRGGKVLVSYFNNEKVNYKDHILLSSGKSRSGFINKLKTLVPKIDEKQTEKELIEIDDFLREIIKGKQLMEQKGEKKEIPLTEEEKKQAEELLKNTDLINIILSDLEKTGCVGEVINKKLLILTCVSCKLDFPLSVIVKGDSSAGKSFIINSVASLFPIEDIISRTRITSQALFYLGKTFLKHKVLIIAERHGAEGSDFPIRSLQSERFLSISVPINDPKTGKITTESYVVEGPIAYIESTTQPHIYNDNENRAFSIFLDESEAQTKEIHKISYNSYLFKNGIPKEEKDIICKKYHNAFRLIKTIHVKIPYVQYIQFPTKPIRVRRDFNRFLSLIESSAFLHQYQRERKIINEKEYVIANIEDYRLAFDIASVVLSQTLKELSLKAEELIQVFTKLVTEKNKKNSDNEYLITRQELCEVLSWSLPTITKYLDEAERVGFIENRSGRHQGKTYEYALIKKLDPANILLLKPEDLQAITAERDELVNL